MNKQDRKNYLINRCYSAQYAKLPKPFKTVNALRYPGLFISILANAELFSIQNLTPECVDVLVTTASKRGEDAYYAESENLDYTLNVFYELNYKIDTLRFVGGEVFAYDKLHMHVKTALRIPKIKRIKIVCGGNFAPNGDNLDVLRNPGLKVLLCRSGTLSKEIEQTLIEREVIYELFDEEDQCDYCENSKTVFVEGKMFRCPISAKKYASTSQADDESCVDIVARKLEIKDLRLAMFDFTNSHPPEKCEDCTLNKKATAASF